MKHLGFVGVTMNVKEFTTLNVNEVTIIVRAVVCMFMNLRCPTVCDKYIIFANIDNKKCLLSIHLAYWTDF